MAKQNKMRRSGIFAIGAGERLLWSLCALILIVFSIAAALSLIDQYQSHLDLAKERLNNLALVHDENLLLQMSNIEGIARATADEVKININDETALREYVTSVAQRLPQLRTVVVVSSSGVIIADSRPDTPGMGIDVGDRAYFTVHEQQQSDKLFIDDPVLSRADATWALPITLGVWNEDDEFLGVVIASLDPTYFSSSIGNFADQDIVGYIVKTDGIILTSLPYVQDQIGVEIPEFELYETHAAGETIVTSNSVTIHRHLEPYGLQIVFSQPRSTITQPFLHDVVLTLAAILILSVITFLIFYQQIRQTQRIQRSEKDFRTLTDNISDFIIRYDQNLRHLYVNPAVLKSTGLTLEQFISKTSRELDMPEERVALWDREIKHVFESKSRHTFEFYFDFPDKRQWFQANLTPEFDQKNEVNAVLSVVRDITELKNSQLELEARNRYQSIIGDLGFIALQTKDLQAFMDKFVEQLQHSLDVEYCKILELTPDGKQLLLRAGVGWHEGIVGHACVETDKRSQAGYTLTTDKPVVVGDLARETRFIAPDLLVDHDVVSGMSIIIYTSTQPYGVLGIHSTQARDFAEPDVRFLESVAGLLSAVIERHRAESQAIQERNLLRSLIDNIPDYIIVKDTEMRIVEANLAYIQLTQRTREQILGATTPDIFGTDMMHQHMADDQAILRDEVSIISAERKIIDAQGNYSWGLVTKIPLKDSDGRIIGLIGISRDITDRIEAESKRLEAERTRIELEEQQKLIDLKERFIATATHDFRTPLSIIQTSTSVLERYADRYTPEQQREKLKNVQNQVRRMTHLLDDFLLISKSHANKLELSLKTIDLREFCDEIWSNIVTLDKGVHLKEINYTTTVQQFMTDPNLLQQVLDNLLTNALKYTPAGKLIKFEIEDEDQCLVFKVTDHGYGIPEEDLQLLFEPFHRAKNVLEIEGTGLGLTIVKDFVELHNGNIDVVSKEGEGTTFTITLPIAMDGENMATCPE